MVIRSLALLLTLTAGSLSASTLFVSYLSGANTNPPNGSTAYGAGTITLSDDQTFISATLSMSNLTSSPTLAGIFGPRSFSTFSPLFLSMPLISNGPSSYFGSASTSVDSFFVSGLRSGLYYFNVFTEAYPSGVLVQGGSPGGPNGSLSDPLPPLYSGGEASGDISEVPEPASALLLACGVVVFWFARHR